MPIAHHYNVVFLTRVAGKCA